MASNQGGPEVGNSLDLSGEYPSEKAYRVPLEHDEVTFSVNSSDVEIKSDIKVRGSLHRAAEFAIISLLDATLTSVAVFLCIVTHTNGWVTMAVAVVVAIAVPVAGRLWTSARSS